MFNETLRQNITRGNRTVTQADVERVDELVQVTELLEDLSNGHETVLGDQGVKISGG